MNRLLDGIMAARFAALGICVLGFVTSLLAVDAQLLVCSLCGGWAIGMQWAVFGEL